MSNKLTAIAPRTTLLLALCIWCFLPAQAANDPLQTPALVSAKADTSMLLSVAQAGARLIAVGERGVIVVSDDQGQNWRQASVPVSVTMTAVQFTSPNKGWAVGHEGVVLSSEDGGLTWTKRFDGHQGSVLMVAQAEKNLARAQQAHAAAQGADKDAAAEAQDEADIMLSDVKAGAEFGPYRPLLGLLFDNAGAGYVVGSYGQIFHTADGGKHWESLANRLNNPVGLHYNALSRTQTGALVIAGERGKVYRSRDDGATWKTFDTGYIGHLYGVLGLADDDGGAQRMLAFGFGGHILQGSDDGSVWREVPAVSKKSLIGAIMAPDGSIVLAAQDGSLLLSNDLGDSFTMLKKADGRAIAAMALLPDGAHIAFAGIGGVRVISSGTKGRLN
ncbi:MAG: photosystem II stability/assembly factor-like uncharacterized protein [Janthinobacterium sp.]|jgi:photosystem II stability/assembly factor-like uncharacterized protein